MRKSLLCLIALKKVFKHNGGIIKKNSTITLSRYARYIKRNDKNRASFLDNKNVQNDTEITPNVKKVC